MNGMCQVLAYVVERSNVRLFDVNSFINMSISTCVRLHSIYHSISIVK